MKEFVAFKNSLDKSQAGTIFKDMAALLDNGMIDVRKQLQIDRDNNN